MVGSQPIETETSEYMPRPLARAACAPREVRWVCRADGGVGVPGRGPQPLPGAATDSLIYSRAPLPGPSPSAPPASLRLTCTSSLLCPWPRTYARAAAPRPFTVPHQSVCHCQSWSFNEKSFNAKVRNFPLVLFHLCIFL
ncbi:hypothetical protein ACQJBY_064616 [Aegilops geniculata]